MKGLKEIRKIIQDELPDFFIASIKKIGEGDNSIAFLINENIVFRFPKGDEARRNNKKEVAALDTIAPYLNLPIPHFQYISKRQSFVGHKMIRGENFSAKIYHSLNESIQNQIQQSIGEFLNRLHHIDLSIIANCHLDMMDYKEEYSDDLETAKRLIYPDLSPNERETTDKIFASYFSNKENFYYRPALIHNDFSTDHILYQKTRREISGIIDFGDLAIGDPDYDLLHLYNSFGVNFIMGLLRFYKHNDPENLLKKLDFYSGANKLQILTGSIEDGEESGIKNGYGNFKEWLKKNRE